MAYNADPACKRSINSWENDLSQNEKSFIGRIVTLVMRTCDPNTPPVSEDIARNYFQAALEGWSAQWQPLITTLKSLNVEESCLCIGVFKRDLPAGDKQLKELGMSAKEVYKEIPNTPRKTSSATGASAFQLQGTVRTTPVTPQKYSARKEGQPAYCRPGIQSAAGNITFDFIDRQGKKVSAEYITFAQGDSMTAAQRIECILRFDNAEFCRLRDWNVKVGIYMIQHYIYNLTHTVPCTQSVAERNLFPISLVGDILVSYQADIAAYNVARACQNQERMMPQNPQRS
jgi:hypothetical protein